MSIFCSASRSTTMSLHFGIQSHWAYSFSPFDSLLSFSFGIQSRFLYLFMHFESPSFLVLVFKVVLSFFWYSEPLPSLSFNVTLSSLWFGLQSHFSYPFRHLILPSFLAFGVSSHHSFRRSEPSHIFVQAPWVTIFPYVVTFRVITSQSYLSESQFLTFISTGITHLTFTVSHSSSLTSLRYSMLIAYSSMLIQISFSTAHDMVFRVHATYISHVVWRSALGVLM